MPKNIILTAWTTAHRNTPLDDWESAALYRAVRRGIEQHNVLQERVAALLVDGH